MYWTCYVSYFIKWFSSLCLFILIIILLWIVIALLYLSAKSLLQSETNEKTTHFLVVVHHFLCNMMSMYTYSKQYWYVRYLCLVSLFEWRKRFLKNISLVLWIFFFFMGCVHFCLDWCVLAARFHSITAFNYSDCHSNSITILHCNFHANITDKSIFLKLWERATSASELAIN